MESCDERLRKVLKPNTTYFFCNDFEDDENGGIRKKSYCQTLSPSFFAIHDESQGPFVNISCVVGQNGDGKSSLVELLIRTINNFAFFSGFRSDNPDLIFIPGVHTKLYYWVNNEIGCICCDGESMEFHVGDKKFAFNYTGNTTFGKERKKKKSVLDFANELFHTFVSNYSLYAYNSCEYEYENQDQRPGNADSWISALFSPNDAYQTPIVLTPRREQGVININREYSLSAQRLGELFLNCKNGEFKISNTEQVKGFVYKLENQSKLWMKTIKDYLLDDSLGKRNIIRFDVDFNNSAQSVDLSNDKVLEFNKEFWENFDKSFFDSGLLPLAYKLIETEGNTDLLSKSTDFGQYLKKLKTQIQKSNERSPLSTSNIRKVIEKGGGSLTFLQFQRIFLVYEIANLWIDLLGLDKHSFFPVMFSGNKPIDHALWYLTYKTIKVLETYPDYFSGGVTDYEIPQHFFHDKVRKNNINKWFTKLQKDIKESQSHQTLKIRQTIYFIEHFESLPLLKQSKESFENVEINGYDYYIDCVRYYKSIKRVRSLANAIPPPFIEMEYMISRNGQSLYPLSRMSSGERQLLNSASSIVYYLKNLTKSYSRGTKLVYQNVNVVLEEVELYFHPEYQRRFVKYLLEQIENANLPNDLSINLMFVTHSPFILSDIPRQNVLFLKDGGPDRSMQEDTFGANIHTLLQNGFFLNSVPIGAFAKEKISKMFAILNQSDEISEESFSLLEKEIPLVSEPLLRSQLMRLFTMRKKFKQGDFQEVITALENRIRYLEEQLYDKN